MVLTRILVLPGWDGERLQTLRNLVGYRRFRIHVRCKRGWLPLRAGAGDWLPLKAGAGDWLPLKAGTGGWLPLKAGAGGWGKPKAIFDIVCAYCSGGA